MCTSTRYHAVRIACKLYDISTLVEYECHFENHLEDKYVSFVNFFVQRGLTRFSVFKIFQIRVQFVFKVALAFNKIMFCFLFFRLVEGGFDQHPTIDQAGLKFPS